MVVCEMTASGELNNSACKSLRRLESEAIPLCVVQLSGCKPDLMARAARIAVDAGADMVDINMGCPAKKVTGGYAGAALMRDPALALCLIKAVVQAIDVPVTLKMRLGWDEASLNAPQLARQAQEAGIKMLTVHGRTRAQLYAGRADWHAVRHVRNAVSIPLVVNGDITTQQEARHALQASGADAVMIGRGGYGMPWLAGSRPPQDILSYILRHYEAMLAHYGSSQGIRHARKHLDWYLQKHCRGFYAADERKAVMTGTDLAAVKTLLETIFNRFRYGQGEAAG